jgi:hypothetical protein
VFHGNRDSNISHFVLTKCRTSTYLHYKKKMWIIVGDPLKQPPNYTSEDFMVPVMIGADSTLNFGIESFFEDKDCWLAARV